jgi:hypothetical protein
MSERGVTAPHTRPAPPDGCDALSVAPEQLWLRLFDVTGRSRLLNLKHTPGRSLRSVNGGVQAIYGHLLDDNESIATRGFPEPHQSECLVRNGRSVLPETADWAAIKRILLSCEFLLADHGEVALPALLYPEDLAKRYRKIGWETNLAIEETGANMLFLVLEFREYPDEWQSDLRFLPPLLNIPIPALSTTTGGQLTFQIERTSPELAESLSLLEKLRVDHALETYTSLRRPWLDARIHLGNRGRIWHFTPETYS